MQPGNLIPFSILLPLSITREPCSIQCFREIHGSVGGGEEAAERVGKVLGTQSVHGDSLSCYKFHITFQAYTFPHLLKYNLPLNSSRHTLNNLLTGHCSSDRHFNS